MTPTQLINIMKEREIEQMASDAIVEKPIAFSVTYKEKRKVEKEVSTVARLFCFKRKIKERILVDTDVDMTKEFVIHPPTLGKLQILSKYYLMLDINEDDLCKEPHIEAMRICESKTDVVCSLMAVATLNTKDELIDDDLISKRAEFFRWNTRPQDFSTVLLVILTQVDYANFISSIRLTKLLRQNKPLKERTSRVE